MKPSAQSLQKTFAGVIASFGPFFRFPGIETDSELAKLIWLVRLRWMAIALFFVLAAPGLISGTLNRDSLPPFVGIIGFLFIFNLLTQLVFIEPRKSVGPLFICFQLTSDLLALSSLLLLSGGFENPFIGLFLLNASLGGILISGRLGWPFLIITHTLLSALQLTYLENHRSEVDGKFLGLVAVSHLLVFSFWLVMRSLGAYLEKQHESQAKSRIQNERQDRLRAVGALAAGFSHEFASPLNTAKLRLERLKRIAVVGNDDKLQEKVVENVVEALSAIEACELVIHQMNSSQLDTRDFYFKSVQINELLMDVVDSWKEEHPGALLALDIKVNTKVQIPPVNFAQVVLNLLDNAFESEPAHEISLVLEGVKDHYSLSIQDKGNGFPDSVLKRIGEPFVTTKPSGTGLGLYVTQLFAQSLGGEMKLENVLDRGARVVLSWPINSAPGNLQ